MCGLGKIGVGWVVWFGIDCVFIVNYFFGGVFF